MTKFEDWLNAECHKLALVVIEKDRKLDGSFPDPEGLAKAYSEWKLAKRILQMYFELTPRK